ncbi:hypothetical protein COV20_03815 [Candidatus Woesearchaeota archaeon CG10_big_fil_rev_8_21_14_0_10_45_16]|nr:MAG: hypothetical protein COV20_03815 [Candidatus Woesearchaeota archaeon CG10_big_fil_rev_8_21_14_0_10_45_16]
MKILVLGGSGFVGIPIVRKLQQSHLLTATYQREIPQEKKCTWVQLDVTKEGTLRSLLNKVEPDLIVNCLAISNIDVCEQDHALCNRINVRPTEIIKDYCTLNQQVRYIFFSTSNVFDNKGSVNSFENDEPNPCNHYGKSKVHCEEIIKTMPHYAIIRPCIIFGIPEKGQHENIFNYIYKGLSTGERFTGFTDFRRSPCYVEDVALLVERIVEMGSEGIFHASGEALTMAEFADKVADFFKFDKSGIRREKSGDTGRDKYRPKNTALNCARTMKELHFTFRPLQASLEDIRRRLI